MTGRPQGGDLWDIHYDVLPWKERLTIAGAVAAGAGAAIALVVSYRKQRDAEEGKFAAGFADAATQLGDAAPAVRMAGAYALAALAARYSQHRQQCIDALCAYLRLPYDPDAAKRNVSTSTTTNATRTETTVYRSDDREVRLTIIRIIRDRLRDPKARTSWREYDLDFTGANFDGGDFSHATFSGTVSFDRAKFSGGSVSFDGVTFSGGSVSFDGATFSGGTVSFDRATFSGGIVSFDGAKFSGGAASFHAAVFSGGSVSFDGAKFSGGAASFHAAVFSGGIVSFDGATFSGSAVTFFGATFSGGAVRFGWATFSDGSVTFDRVTFSGSAVTFTEATFRGGAATHGGKPFRGWSAQRGFEAVP